MSDKRVYMVERSTAVSSWFLAADWESEEDPEVFNGTMHIGEDGRPYILERVGKKGEHSTLRHEPGEVSRWLISDLAVRGAGKRDNVHGSWNRVPLGRLGLISDYILGVKSTRPSGVFFGSQDVADRFSNVAKLPVEDFESNRRLWYGKESTVAALATMMGETDG